MCTGLEIFTALGAAASAASGIKALTTKTPQAVQQSPVADAASADAKALSEANARTLAQRRAARANSLLSAAGAAGDTSDPLTSAASALGKGALGA